jgi:ribonuclease-3
MMDFNELHRIIGETVEPELLEEALTHRSFGEGLKTIPNLERLEFLGDSVLGFVVTEEIFNRYPHLDETKLTQVRISLVSEPNLAVAAKRCGLNNHVRVGKGVIKQGDSQRPSILADAFEAVIGAIFVDKGLEAASRFVHREILDHLSEVQELLHQFDPRSDLADLCIKAKLALRYEYSHSGPDNARVHTAVVFVNEQPIAEGSAATRKAAATAAASAALALPRFAKGGKAKAPLTKANAAKAQATPKTAPTETSPEA